LGFKYSGLRMNKEIPFASLRKGACGQPVPHDPHSFSYDFGDGPTFDIMPSCDGHSTVHCGGIAIDPNEPETGDF
jgi:hypothetical protein